MSLMKSSYDAIKMNSKFELNIILVRFYIPLSAVYAVSVLPDALP